MLTPDQIQNLKPGDECIAKLKFVSAGKSSLLFELPGMELIEISQRNRDCLDLPSEYTRIYFPEVMVKCFTPDEIANLTSFLADYTVDVRRKNELRNSLKKAGFDLGNIQPKHATTVEELEPYSCSKTYQATAKRTNKVETTLLTQRKTAQALGVCVTTVRRWKDCPRVRISPGRYRYDLAAVRAWLETHTEAERDRLNAERRKNQNNE